MRKVPCFLGLVAMTAACSPDPATNPDRNTAAAAAPAPAGTPAPLPTPPVPVGRVSEYSSLSNCRVITSKPEEAGYSSSDCPGLAGYTLRLVNADARQNLFVQTPSGSEHSLRLSEAAGSGFSRIGERVEWRGTMEGPDFRPDAMLLRYYVVEREGAGETAYLLPVKLAGGTPCVADRFAPGPDQSREARRAADSPMTCFKR